jgi:glycosyltransferase involved in cell wall biosynthesis
VLKEAIALDEAGHQVHVLNSIHSIALLNEDLSLIAGTKISYEAISDASANSFTTLRDKLFRKIGTMLVKKFRIQNPNALGYGLNRYIKRCRELAADLYICHQELPTYVGTVLLKHGYKVGFDLEDWYSEDLSVQKRMRRPVDLLKKLERTALNKGVFCITTSHAMAFAMAQRYSSKVPNVIYNVFEPVSVETIAKSSNPMRLIWFSQTIGFDRGIEEFIAGLNMAEKSYELHLLGNCAVGFNEIILGLINSRHKVIFHSLKPVNELMPFLSSFDIGLALEKSCFDSRTYTITNKLFQYIESGLPVIASRTSGQDEIMNRYQCGWQVDLETPDIVATVLNNIEPRNWKEMRERAISASKYLDWNNEKKKLLSIIHDSLKGVNKNI